MRLRAYLLIMIGTIILPISLFAAIALQTLLSSEREAALQALHQNATATALLVDRELSSAEAALHVLARSPHLAHGDLAGFYEHAKSADRGDGGRLILFDAGGQQLINTVVPLGGKLPPTRDEVRARLRQVMATRKTLVSDLITGPLQKNPVTSITVPVPLFGGERYVLGSVFAPDYFSRLMARRPVPSSWTVSVIDHNGRFIVGPGGAVRLGQPANPGLVKAALDAQQGLIRYAMDDGVDAYHAFVHSPMSGWTVAVAVPAGEIEGTARHAVMLAAAGMLVALLCASVAAVFFGRRLATAIGGAAQAATRLSEGGGLASASAAAAASSGIAEFDALQRAIGEAGIKLARSETERASLLQREQQARKLAEAQVRIRDDFLAMLSHELRNPLSGILGAAQLLRIENANPVQKRHAQDILLRQGKHLTRIVDDLLDLARLARGKVRLDMRPVELASVAEAVVDALRMAGRVEQQLDCRLEPAWILGDRTRIEQVVGNLITNALKYTPAQGRIEIALKAGEDEACLVVHDSGVGIAPELMPTLFETFVQGAVSLDRAQGGLGIGLSLVRSLVTLHGGSVTAASEGNGKGSTFTLCLPLLKEGAQTAAVVESAPPAAHESAVSTVLLIEDNNDARHMLSAQLSAAGYQVFEADNGVDGIALARRERPDLAIVDIGLPGMNGYQIAARLRRDPDTKMLRLVALTGYGQEADRQLALNAGFDAHFAKPLQFESLADILAGVSSD
ncbi:MAG: hybrid sensor histidine kinase/response regulator [Oxalobacteraceae bacterium]|nr:MAG: hybrid sensor histidine kinase/response regulator [Oxalobacteraceae bacterium]